MMHNFFIEQALGDAKQLGTEYLEYFSSKNAEQIPKELRDSPPVRGGYRKKAESLFSSGRVVEGMELVLFCAYRLYIFPDVSDKIYFLSLAGSYAISIKNVNLLRYVLLNLIPLSNRGGSAPLQRLIAKGGGVANIIKQSHLKLGTRIELVMLGAHQTISGSIWGRAAVKGVHFYLSALRQVREATGENHVHLLPCKKTSPIASSSKKHDKLPILVTRAMGGIGDILMMTPGLAALKAQYPEREIHFSLAKDLHSVLLGNTDIVITDINANIRYQDDYCSWYNLTECPATRIEALTLPYVCTNRIDAYAAAMGLNPDYIPIKLPRYYITEEERKFAKQFLALHNSQNRSVVGIHLSAADSYKDYADIATVIQALAQNYLVLLFHNQLIAGYDFANVIKVDHHSLREAFALLAECAVCVGPDSAFLHASAALNIPFVAFFGPTSGKIFTKYYPLVTVIEAEESCASRPCWRNQAEPCLQTGCWQSKCLQQIIPGEIVRKLKNILSN